jgi:ATP synthase F1, epsilon subunit
MKTFRLILSSPYGNIFDGNAQKLILRGHDGDLAVLAGHVPMITEVRSGAVYVTLEDGTEKEAVTDKGLLAVSPDCVTVTSGKIEFEDE